MLINGDVRKPRYDCILKKVRLYGNVYDGQNTGFLIKSGSSRTLVHPGLTLGTLILVLVVARGWSCPGQGLGGFFRNDDQFGLTHFLGHLVLSHQHILSKWLSGTKSAVDAWNIAKLTVCKETESLSLVSCSCAGTIQAAQLQTLQ